MNLQARKEISLLLFGDLIFFFISLWLTLWLRYLAWPDTNLVTSHLRDFVWILPIWLLVFFISDLYTRSRAGLRRRLPQTIIRAQVINGLIATAFFYFIPYFSLSPKVNLFIYVAVATVSLLVWRLWLWPLVYRGRRERLVFLGEEPEMLELMPELEANPHYNLEIKQASGLLEAKKMKPAAIVVNIYHPQFQALLVDFYRLLFAGVSFLPLHRLYEETFGRIPVSIINERWFMENISNRRRITYDLLKRLMDIGVASFLVLVTLPFYPLIWLMIQLDDGGPLFFFDERIGRGGRVIRLAKFRSMTMHPKLEERVVTRVGKWLRSTRLDEIPQLIGVIRGDQSLVGPRPERPDYVEIYREQIPYYDARHLISPGLSGWAQIYHESHPHFRPKVEDTKDKLAYDLYYIKNRGIWLDLEIALKTVRALLSRTGI